MICNFQKTTDNNIKYKTIQNIAFQYAALIFYALHYAAPWTNQNCTEYYINRSTNGWSYLYIEAQLTLLPTEAPAQHLIQFWLNPSISASLGCQPMLCPPPRLPAQSTPISWAITCTDGPPVTYASYLHQLPAVPFYFLCANSCRMYFYGTLLVAPKTISPCPNCPNSSPRP